MTNELVEGLTLEPFPLPFGVAHVLQRQRLELGLPALFRRRIRHGELMCEDSDRPGVEDDVVHDKNQHMIVGRYLEKTGTPERR